MPGDERHTRWPAGAAHDLPRHNDRQSASPTRPRCEPAVGLSTAERPVQDRVPAMLAARTGVPGARAGCRANRSSSLLAETLGKAAIDVEGGLLAEARQPEGRRRGGSHTAPVNDTTNLNTQTVLFVRGRSRSVRGCQLSVPWPALAVFGPRGLRPSRSSALGCVTWPRASPVSRVCGGHRVVLLRSGSTMALPPSPAGPATASMPDRLTLIQSALNDVRSLRPPSSVPLCARP